MVGFCPAKHSHPSSPLGSPPTVPSGFKSLRLSPHLFIISYFDFKFLLSFETC